MIRNTTCATAMQLFMQTITERWLIRVTGEKVLIMYFLNESHLKLFLKITKQRGIEKYSPGIFPKASKFLVSSNYTRAKRKADWLIDFVSSTKLFFPKPLSRVLKKLQLFSVFASQWNPLLGQSLEVIIKWTSSAFWNYFGIN